MNKKGGRCCRPPLIWLATLASSQHNKKPPPTANRSFPRSQRDTPAQQPAESPPAQPAYPAAPWPNRDCYLTNCHPAPSRRSPATVGHPNLNTRKPSSSYCPSLCPWCLPSLSFSTVIGKFETSNERVQDQHWAHVINSMIQGFYRLCCHGYA